MGRLEIEFGKEAAKQYERLPKEYRSLVGIALSKLSEGLELDLKPVQGQKDVYRIRVGKISPRGDVYKK